MSERGFVTVDLGAPDAAGRLRAFVAGRACVRCGAAATTARTRRFGLLAIPQGHCARCAGRHRLLAIATILRTLLGLAVAATLAWLLLAYYRASAGPPALAVLGGFLGFFLLGFLLERARAVRVLGVRKRRVILSFKNRAGARAFLDANGLAQAAVHESLADAISDAT